MDRATGENHQKKIRRVSDVKRLHPGSRNPVLHAPPGRKKICFPVTLGMWAVGFRKQKTATTHDSRQWKKHQESTTCWAVDLVWVPPVSYLHVFADPPMRDFSDQQYHYQFDHKSVITSCFMALALIWRQVHIRIDRMATRCGPRIFCAEEDCAAWIFHMWHRTIGIGELSKGWSKTWLRLLTVAIWAHVFLRKKQKTRPDCVLSVSQDLFLFLSVFPFS